MTWQERLRDFYVEIDELDDRLIEDPLKVQQTVQTLPMRIPQYYYDLINKDDPKDPIRLMSVAGVIEGIEGGELDTSGESTNTKLQGLQHKYDQTALILTTSACFMYCRFCFRKRLVGINSAEINQTLSDAAEYIREHKEITNVLLTGGDSFHLSNAMIEKYLQELTNIEHLDFIRFGTRTPVVFPYRITEDPELLDILEKYNKDKQIYVITHFNHPNELTDEAKKAVQMLLSRRIPVLNQTVLLEGVNADENVLARLMNGLCGMGVQPYYVFQCRPVKYVKDRFELPISKGYDIIEGAKKKMSGPAKRFRFAMSHPRGKIEMVAKTDTHMIFRFVQAKHAQDASKVFTLPIDETGRWLDENLNWLG